jgi:hypothetical protein
MHLRRLIASAVPRHSGLFGNLYSVATILSLSVFLIVGSARAYQFPAGVVGATDYRQCAALGQQWSAVMAEISRDHEACLDSHGGRTTSESGSCSVAECQDLHDLLYTTGPNSRTAQNDSCLSSVSHHLQWQREYDARLAAEQQAAAQRNAENQQWQQRELQRQQQLQQNRAEQGRQALEAYRQAQQARSAANTANNAGQRPGATIAGAVFGFLSDLARNSARSSPPIDTEDKRDYSSEHDLLTDMGRSGTTNPMAREVLTGASNQLKDHNLDMIGRMDQINQDLNSFASSSGGRSNTATFTPQTLNAAIDAELSTSAPAVSQQMRVNEAIDAELSRNAPAISQQMRLNEAIDEEMNRTAPALSQQMRLNAAIDEEMRQGTLIASQNSSSSSASSMQLVTLADGSQFQGDLLNGKPSGKGVLVDTKGVRYEGNFENGKIKSGVAIYPDGTRLNVVNGKIEVKG